MGVFLWLLQLRSMQIPIVASWENPSETFFLQEQKAEKVALKFSIHGPSVIIKKIKGK